MTVSPQRLRAVPASPAEVLDWAAAADCGSPARPLVTSGDWWAAAIDALGAAAFTGVWLRDGTTTAGALLLQQDRADWRTGSPGQPALGWPLARLGYGYGPNWADSASGESHRDDWLPLLREAFPRHRLHLAHTTPGTVGAAPAGWRIAPGPVTWTSRVPPTAAEWLKSLQGRHRRDFTACQRRIETHGGVWHEAEDFADPALLDAVFALHRHRMEAKATCAGATTAAEERFLRRLAGRLAGRGLRLSVLELDGRFAAGILAFVRNGHYQAFVSGWDRRHHKLDLGRQVVYHQVLREFGRGLACIDLLGGDLPYKLEFGLAAHPTIDLVGPASPAAALRERLVGTALGTYRRLRRQLTGGPR